METSAGTFEIMINEGSEMKRLIIRPQDTTDGVPVYHGYSTDGIIISQLRQEPTGEWIQIWGDMPPDSVVQIGKAITHHMA